VCSTSCLGEASRRRLAREGVIAVHGVAHRDRAGRPFRSHSSTDAITLISHDRSPRLAHRTDAETASGLDEFRRLAIPLDPGRTLFRRTSDQPASGSPVPVSHRSPEGRTTSGRRHPRTLRRRDRPATAGCPTWGIESPMSPSCDYRSGILPIQVVPALSLDRNVGGRRRFRQVGSAAARVRDSGDFFVGNRWPAIQTPSAPHGTATYCARSSLAVSTASA